MMDKKCENNERILDNKLKELHAQMDTTESSSLLVDSTTTDTNDELSKQQKN